VDAADCVVWRKAFGSTTDLAAEGNGNGTDDDGDYQLWRSSFGAALPAVGGSEPSSVLESSTYLLLTRAAWS